MEITLRIEDLETLVDAAALLEAARTNAQLVPAALASASVALNTITATVQQDEDERLLERAWGAD